MILDLINIISDFKEKITSLILHNFKLMNFFSSLLKTGSYLILNNLLPLDERN